MSVIVYCCRAKTKFFRISNDWFTVSDTTGDVLTIPAFPSNVQATQTLNVIFIIVLENEMRLWERALAVSVS